MLATLYGLLFSAFDIMLFSEDRNGETVTSFFVSLSLEDLVRTIAAHIWFYIILKCRAGHTVCTLFARI